MMLRILTVGLPERWTSAIVFAGALAAGGCGGISEDGATAAERMPPTVRDSAGIELVEMGAQALSELPRWRVADSASLVIGLEDGEEPYLFGAVTAGLRLSGGEIVVADSRAVDLRLFDQDGVFLRRLGRRGEGPGEYSSVFFLYEMADGSVGVVDNRPGRLTTFSLDGELRTTLARPCRPGGAQPVSMDYEPCIFVGVTGDGTFVTSASFYMDGSTHGLMDVAMRADQGWVVVEGGWLLLAVTQGQRLVVVDSLARAGQASKMIPPDPPAEPAFMGYQWMTDQIFHPRGQYAVGPSGFVAGRGDRFELHYRDPQGDLYRIVRVDGPRRVASPALVDSLRALAPEPESTLPSGYAEAASEYFDAVEVSGALPPHGELLFDDAGRVWVSPNVLSYSLKPRGPEEWVIFDDSGLPLAEIETPVSADILDIDEDFILVRTRDDLGVNRVALYRIERGG